MRQDDLIRELEKAREALHWAEEHLVKVNEANAALHCNTTVWHSPLTTQVHNARESMERVIADLRADIEAKLSLAAGNRAQREAEMHNRSVLLGGQTEWTER